MKSLLFQNTLKALNFRFVLPSGKTLTEYISNQSGLLTTVGTSESAQIQIPGNNIAPEHIKFSFDRHNTYIEVLTPGFPIAINGQMFGFGQKVPVREKTSIRIGEVNACLWMDYKQDGLVKRMVLSFGGGLLIGLFLISLISNLFIQINRYNLMLENAATNPSFQERVEIFSNAAAILNQYPVIQYLINENKYQEQINQVLTEQYFITPINKAEERDNILNTAKSLGADVPELKQLYDTEMWAKNTVIKWDKFFNKGNDTTYTLPIFAAEAKEPDAKSALKYCKGMVEIIDQSQKLKTNHQLESAIQLLFGSALIKDSNKYTKFFKSLLLYRTSCLLAEYSNLKNHNEILLSNFRKEYKDLDPKFEFVSNDYLKKNPNKRNYVTPKKPRRNKQAGPSVESRIIDTEVDKYNTKKAHFKALLNRNH